MIREPINVHIMRIDNIDWFPSGKKLYEHVTCKTHIHLPANATKTLALVKFSL